MARQHLSSNPVTVRNQIQVFETLIETFEQDLQNTPTDDPGQRTVIRRDLKTEKASLRKLQQHLDHLEDNYNAMLEMGPVSHQTEVREY